LELEAPNKAKKATEESTDKKAEVKVSDKKSDDKAVEKNASEKPVENKAATDKPTDKKDAPKSLAQGIDGEPKKLLHPGCNVG
jgi:hypothetical protein